jgi:hypothetical protein
MIDLDRFDNWPPDADARKPDTWPSPVLLEVFEALTEIRAQELNPLEFAIVDHAYALVRRTVDRVAGKSSSRRLRASTPDSTSCSAATTLARASRAADDDDGFVREPARSLPAYRRSHEVQSQC